MRNAVVKRRTKRVKVEHPVKNKAQVLKFNRRDGLVMMEKPEPVTKLNRFAGLVRKLLVSLGLIAPMPQTAWRAKAGRSRGRKA